MADRPEILLVTDNKTVLPEMGRDGKFSAKSNAWEENKVFLEGGELVTRVEGGRCSSLYTHRRTGSPVLPAPTWIWTILAPRRPITMAKRNAVTGLLRCNSCDVTLCCSVTVTAQRSLGAARSTGR
jgi:hypothetical protein